MLGNQSSARSLFNFQENLVRAAPWSYVSRPKLRLRLLGIAMLVVWMLLRQREQSDDCVMTVGVHVGMMMMMTMMIVVVNHRDDDDGDHNDG